MALNFPLNPADGDTYENYVYDATEGVWNANPQQLASRFITSATQPSTPSNGDGWLDTNTGKTYIYYNDGSSAQWIESGNPVIGFVDPYDQDSTSTGYFSLPKGTSAQRPVTPSNGDIRFNTELGEPEYYSETESDWFLFRQQAISGLPIQYLVIAGGGSGGVGTNVGGRNMAGGAGAGGYRCNVSAESSGGGSSAEEPLFLPFGSYTVTVGAGAPGTSTAGAGAKGSDSIFSSVTSEGGGWGGGDNLSGGTLTGGDGGSGGGARTSSSGDEGEGVPGQGFNGGVNAGGGGGAGGAGANGSGTSTSTGTGGIGISSSITGSATGRAGGGGGSGGSGTSTVSSGGGFGQSSGNGGSGTANTGGGGGASSTSTSGSGGSGVVIVKYPLTNTMTASVGLTAVTSVVGDYRITQFTAGTGTVTFS